jgi:hypothetical protein
VKLTVTHLVQKFPTLYNFGIIRRILSLNTTYPLKFLDAQAFHWEMFDLTSSEHVISITECLFLFSLHSSAIDIPCVCMYYMFRPIAPIIRYTELLQWPFFLSYIHPNTYLIISAIGQSMQYMHLHGLFIP